MAAIELSRFYPAPPDETYAALLGAVRERAKFQSTEGFSRSVAFATKMTGWASGANVSAYVIPEGDGSTVRMEAQAKMRTQVNANNAAHKQLVAILDAVGGALRAERGEAVPPSTQPQGPFG